MMYLVFKILQLSSTQCKKHSLQYYTHFWFNLSTFSSYLHVSHIVKVNFDDKNISGYDAVWDWQLKQQCKQNTH